VNLVRVLGAGLRGEREGSRETPATRVRARRRHPKGRAALGPASRLLGGLLLALRRLLGRLLRAALLRDLRGLLGSGFTSGLGLGLLSSHFRLPPRHSGRRLDCRQPEGMLHDVYCHLV